MWTASASAGLGWPGARDLTRRDSLLYLSIAHRGYTLFRCDRAGGWCGNAGWFPLYPVLVSPLIHLGISGPVAGALLSGVLQLAALVLLWRRLLSGAGRPATRVSALLAAAVFPGAVYHAAVFPMSLLAALVLAALALERTHLLAAAACVGLACATHPIGVALAVGLAVAVARADVRRAVVHLGAGLCGLVAVGVAQWISVGHLNGYLLVQRHYGHGGTNPVETLRLAKESTFTFLRDPHRLDLVPQVQTVIVALFVLAVLAATIAARRTLAEGDAALAIFTALAWAGPLLLGGISLYRSDAALLPSLALARRLPRPVLAVFVLAAAPVAFEVGRLFFDNALA